MEEDIERSLDAGFSEHLTKPVSIDRLQAAIAELENSRN
jgi:CheY-like chemotaxis protein